MLLDPSFLLYPVVNIVLLADKKFEMFRKTDEKSVWEG